MVRHSTAWVMYAKKRGRGREETDQVPGDNARRSRRVGLIKNAQLPRQVQRHEVLAGPLHPNLHVEDLRAGPEGEGRLNSPRSNVPDFGCRALVFEQWTYCDGCAS